MRRSTEGPSTVVSPSNSIPSSTKNAIAASRSSTTMRTLSIRRIVMVVLLLRRAACRGHSCPWDGASATFSTPDTTTIQDTRQLPQQAPAQYHLTSAASVRDHFRTSTGRGGLTRRVGPSGALCPVLGGDHEYLGGGLLDLAVVVEVGCTAVTQLTSSQLIAGYYALRAS